MLKSRRPGMKEFRYGNKSYGTPTSHDNKLIKYCTSAQAINSGSHPYHMLGRAKGNVGGDFLSNKVEVVIGDESPRWYKSAGINNQWANEYRDIVLPHSEVKSLLIGLAADGQSEPEGLVSYLQPKMPHVPTKSNMDAMGAKAVDLVKPTNSTAESAVALAELLSERKFFSLPGKNSTVEGEYLNYMFGVAPTIGLAQDLREAIENREAIIDQLIRDSGRWVRRRMQFDASYDTLKTAGTAYPTGLGGAGSTSVFRTGRWTKTESRRQRFWFSGAFTYHLPKEGVARDLAKLDKLYGVKPGLSTPWELLPFSWLVDYKTSAGSAISNMESWSQDGLVMPYGYIMCTTKTIVEYTWEGEVRLEGADWSPHSYYTRVEYEQKRRDLANPFGFGILPGDLSTRQMSILAALGISLLR